MNLKDEVKVSSEIIGLRKFPKSTGSVYMEARLKEISQEKEKKTLFEVFLRQEP